MSTVQNGALLSQHKVTPDVLSSDINPSYELTVSWPETTLDRPAEELDLNQTQPQPKLSLSPAVWFFLLGSMGRSEANSHRSPPSR
jgi:hypothetical protein